MQQVTVIYCVSYPTSWPGTCERRLGQDHRPKMMSRTNHSITLNVQVARNKDKEIIQSIQCCNSLHSCRVADERFMVHPKTWAMWDPVVLHGHHVPKKQLKTNTFDDRREICLYIRNVQTQPKRSLKSTHNQRQPDYATGKGPPLGCCAPGLKWQLLQESSWSYIYGGRSLSQ